MEVRSVRQQLDCLYNQKQQADNQLLEVQRTIDEKNQEVYNIQTELVGLNASRSELNESLNMARGQVENQKHLLQEYEKMHEERYKKTKEETDNKIRITEEECIKIINEKKVATQSIIAQYDLDAESERQKYLSIIATIANSETDEERDIQRHINIREAAQDDINYLLNNVANRLSNPDILYKLIWSEYIQKPTNDMLDFILPQKDCPGIYKITYDRNKKSYIGRSTSVRKRLIDHIKSAIGISTIANQRIHDIMRENGLWNFTFELIEECDKDKLNEREKYYIDFFQTAEATFGYNQKAGG